MTTGVVSGWGVLIDRYNYGGPDKISAVEGDRIRQHCQVSHIHEDELLLGNGGYLWGAISEIENRSNLALINQKRRHFIGEELLDSLEGVTVALERGPAIAITSVQYLDVNEATQTLPASLYRLSGDDIYFKSGDYPTFAEGPGVLWVNYDVGHGTVPTSVPAEWQNLVMMVAMRRYETREGADGQTDKAWEFMIDRLVVVAGGSRRY